MNGLTRTQASVLASMQGVTHSARSLEREGYIEKFNVRASGGAELRLTEKGKKA